jgi:hypothetical protein
MKTECIKMPCAKFAAAIIVTIGSLIFSCIMLGLSDSKSQLVPFYCSLITSAITFWAQPPSYKDTNNDLPT